MLRTNRGVPAPRRLQVPLGRYTVDRTPDYDVLGSPVDRAIAEAFPDGKYIVRALGMQEQPGKSLDELVAIILSTGTDKYDPLRRAVGHDEFSGYDYDIQAGPLEVRRGRLRWDRSDGSSTWFGGVAKHFYEGAPIDRGYAVRVDLLLLYDPAKVVRARKRSARAKGVRRGLNRSLYRFLDPTAKKDALVGLVEILR